MTKEPPAASPPPPLAALRQATRRTLSDWRGHAIYGIVAAIAGSVILAPAGTWLLMRVLASGGGSVVNTDIAKFVISWRGLLSFVLWSSLVGVVAVITAAGHAHLAASSALGRHPTVREVVRMVGVDLLRVPGRGGARLALLAALGAPLIGASITAITALLFAPVRGLDDLRNVVPRGLPVPLWMVAVAMAVLLVLFSWLYVRWSLAIPSLALERVSMTEAIRRSVRRIRGSFVRVGAAHLVHHVTFTLVFALMVLLLRLAGRPILISLFERSQEAGAIGVAVLVAVFSALGGALGLFATARLVSLTVIHHAALGGALERPGTADRVDPRRLRAGGLVLGLAAVIAFAVTAWVALPRVRAELRRAAHPTKVAAHRGGALEAPENTFASLENAIEARAEFYELDVQQSKDGVLVVVHDANLKRLAGVDSNVGTLNAAELARLDVGSHFSPTFRDARIPTLEQMIDAARDRISLAIEIKTNGHENDAFVSDFVALLERKDFTSRCVVISLESRFLAQVRQLNEKLEIGIIITAKVGTASDFDVDFYAVQPLIATPDFIREAHAEGREVYVWTVDDRGDMSRLADRGVDVLITDRPRLAREVLGARTTADGLRAAVRRVFRLD